jgi:hypothetical protein
VQQLPDEATDVGQGLPQLGPVIVELDAGQPVARFEGCTRLRRPPEFLSDPTHPLFQSPRCQTSPRPAPHVNGELLSAMTR